MIEWDKVWADQSRRQGGLDCKYGIYRHRHLSSHDRVICWPSMGGSMGNLSKMRRTLVAHQWGALRLDCIWEGGEYRLTPLFTSEELFCSAVVLYEIWHEEEIERPNRRKGNFGKDRGLGDMWGAYIALVVACQNIRSMENGYVEKKKRLMENGQVGQVWTVCHRSAVVGL